MTLDDTAAAYGLVQVVFADVTDHLAFATFTLQQREEANISFPHRHLFGQWLSDFKCQLKRLKDVQSLDDALTALREVCRELKVLSGWRNERIHARVRQVEDGLALYNARTGQRLSISYEECIGIIERLVKAKSALWEYLPVIVRELDLDKEFKAFWKERLDEIEDLDCEKQPT
jgi:hypothetical protein